MSIYIKEYKPSKVLRQYVETYWTGEFNLNSLNNFKQRVVPYGFVELIIHLSDFHCELLQGSDFSPSPDYTLIGLFTKPYEVHFKKRVRVFGIRFKPEGIYHTFGIPASEFHHNYIDIESIVGKEFRDFCSRIKETKFINKIIGLIEEYLSSNIASDKVNLHYLNRAAEIIRKNSGNISINELSEKTYISKRQLQREFKQKLGISPKSYMRIARLNEVNRKLINGERVDLTDISYTAGFSDQPHFIRDFKEFTGESPKVFINTREKFIVNPNSADLS